VKDDQLQRLSPTETSNRQRQLPPNNVSLLTPRRAQMPDTFKTGTILIKEGTLLPEVLRFESEPCAPGWRLVKNLDGYGLGRKIREAGWTFSLGSGEIGATVFGLDEQKTLSRAVQQILANLESAEFNSLEIMRVASETSKRFPGVRYVTVSAQVRHIQESAIPFRAKDRPVWDRARSAAA
jgi:hypothetical protein